MVAISASAAHQGEARNGSAAQIVECQPNNASLVTCLAPARAEAVWRPWAAFRIEKDDRALLRHRIERGLERRSDWDSDTDGTSTAPDALGLHEANRGSVVGGPREAQQVPLPLSGPQRKQKRQVQMRRSMLEESGPVLDAPHGIDARSMVDAAAALARVDRDLAAPFRPGEHQGEHRPRIVRLPLRPQRQLVAPIEKDAARARIGERLERTISKFLLDLRNLSDVVPARARAQAAKVLALLIGLRQNQHPALRCWCFHRDGSVVMREKHSVAWLAVESRTAAPRVPVCLRRPVRELGNGPVQSFSVDAHSVLLSLRFLFLLAQPALDFVVRCWRCDPTPADDHAHFAGRISLKPFERQTPRRPRHAQGALRSFA